MLRNHKKSKLITGMKVGEERVKKVTKPFTLLMNPLLILFVLGSLFGTTATLGIEWFNTNYVLQSPVLFQMPIKHRIISPIPLDVKITITPIPSVTKAPVKQEKKATSEADIVKTSKYPDFIDHIWERESGRGTNKSGLHGYCLKKGQVNPFGFYPSGNWCWDTFEEGVRRLERWYEVEGAGLSYAQKLCYYNGAGKVSDCPYLGYNFEQMK